MPTWFHLGKLSKRPQFLQQAQLCGCDQVNPTGSVRRWALLYLFCFYLLCVLQESLLFFHCVDFWDPTQAISFSCKLFPHGAALSAQEVCLLSWMFAVPSILTLSLYLCFVDKILWNNGDVMEAWNPGPHMSSASQDGLPAAFLPCYRTPVVGCLFPFPQLWDYFWQCWHWDHG